MDQSRGGDNPADMETPHTERQNRALTAQTLAALRAGGCGGGDALGLEGAPERDNHAALARRTPPP